MFRMTPQQMRRVSHMRLLAASGDARSLRIEQRISLRELAETLGASPSTVSRWEQGHTTPRATSALRWADVLQVAEAA
jgi:transcriptional regulator with XRE-family HTH domain